MLKKIIYSILFSAIILDSVLYFSSVIIPWCVSTNKIPISLGIILVTLSILFNGALICFLVEKWKKIFYV